MAPSSNRRAREARAFGPVKEMRGGRDVPGNRVRCVPALPEISRQRFSTRRQDLLIERVVECKSRRGIELIGSLPKWNRLDSRPKLCGVQPILTCASQQEYWHADQHRKRYPA
jgi:hypothetical protein